MRHAASAIAAPGFLGDLAALAPPGGATLAQGLGRSYGDVCLNGGGGLILTEHLDRLIAADWERGLVEAEAGLSIGALLELAVPRGWFVPVTPGTKFVTLGGAVANDVHGKNHHQAGTFGCHVTRLTLRRSSGETLAIGPDHEPALFAATVGGLGLTGIITTVELKLDRILSSDFEVETQRLRHLDDFFTVAEASADWPYTVAWVDCLARGAELGRGLFSRGRPAAAGPLRPHRRGQRLAVPVDAPAALLGPATVRAFNALYARQPADAAPRRLPYDTFLYPLDGIAGWNRLYGRRGFFQHQSCVPLADAPRTLTRLLELDIVLDAGGRLYPAKDATMTPRQFQEGYPNWRALEAARDPGLCSDFWRRVTRKAA